MSFRRIETLQNHLCRRMCNGKHVRVVVPGDVVAVTVCGKARDGTIAGFFADDKTAFVVHHEAEGSKLRESLTLQPSLSQTVLGMRLGETRTFCVKPEDQEHPQSRRNEELVVEIPKSPADNLSIGAVVQIQFQGRARLATVINIKSENSVVVDMNDPLAGQALFMNVSLRSFDALDELEQALFPFEETDRQHALANGKLFSRQELAQYNGKSKPQIYISIKGLVYDVTGMLTKIKVILAQSAS